MNTQESEMSALMLANVEALAQNECDDWIKGTTKGTVTITTTDYIIVDSGFPFYTDEKIYIQKDCEACVDSNASNACDFGSLKAC